MQSRIPPEPISSPHYPHDPSLSRPEQVFGTRPVPVAGVQPLVGDQRGDSASTPVSGETSVSASGEIPKKRLRQAHTRFGIIIASLFGFYLVWTFVQAARDVEREQTVPAEVSP